MSNILLAIDVQKEFRDTRGKYKKCIDYINNYKDQYDKVVITGFINDKSINSNFIKKLKYKECQNVDFDSFEFDLYGMQIVYKYGYSLPLSFFNKKDNVYVIGCNIDACVLATCFNLWDDNINFKILKDYTFTNNKNYDWKNIEQIFINNFGKDIFIKGLFFPKSKK